MNGEKGYHLFADLAWRNWTVMAAFADHDIIQPISWGNTIFNDRGTNVNDQRNFIDASFEHQIDGGTLRWRTYYDSYYCNGRYDYALTGGSGIEDNRQTLLGDWIGTQLTYRFRSSPAGDFTVVAEGSVDLRMHMADADLTPVPFQFANTNNPDRSIAFVVQDREETVQPMEAGFGTALRRSRNSVNIPFLHGQLSSINAPNGPISSSTAAAFAILAYFSCSTAMGFPPRTIPAYVRNRPIQSRSTSSGSSESG